jgi:hypothetical protein
VGSDGGHSKAPGSPGLSLTETGKYHQLACFCRGALICKQPAIGQGDRWIGVRWAREFQFAPVCLQFHLLQAPARPWDSNHSYLVSIDPSALLQPSFSAFTLLPLPPPSCCCSGRCSRASTNPPAWWCAGWHGWLRTPPHSRCGGGHACLSCPWAGPAACTSPGQ